MNYRKNTRKRSVVYYVSRFGEFADIEGLFYSSLEIPSDVQRCCPRCYDKLTVHVRQRHASRTAEDDDEVTLSGHQNSKHDDGNRKEKGFDLNILLLCF